MIPRDISMGCCENMLIYFAVMSPGILCNSQLDVSALKTPLNSQSILVVTAWNFEVGGANKYKIA